MNRLYLVVSVLFALIHGVSWGMLTIGNNNQTRSLKKLYTKEKCEKDEQQALEKSQIFLNSFGQKSLNRTSASFCELSKKGQQKALPCLSRNKKLLLWFGVNGLDAQIYATLFNDNQKVANEFRDKPINEVLEVWAHAKEMMKWCPMGNLQEQHYMMLKDGQGNVLASVDQEKIVHSADIPKFMKAFKVLNDIDPEMVKGIKRITDKVKIYPSLGERVSVFCNSIRSSTLDIVGKVGGAAFVIEEGLGICKYGFKDNMSYLSFTVPYCFVLLSATVAYIDWKNYQHNLKYNILPNQSTLTDYIQKYDPNIFANTL